MADYIPQVNQDKLFAIDVEFKCPLKWSSMKGDSLVRHCDSCKQNVYNGSNLSREEAVALITEKEGDLCVRFYQRPDGSVVTRECFSIFGTEKARAKLPILATANAILSSTALTLLVMLGPASVTIVQGGMAPMAVRSEQSTAGDKGVTPKADESWTSLAQKKWTDACSLLDTYLKTRSGR